MNQPPIPAGLPDPSRKGSESGRRHDLDALRSAAMLLGIAYHAALSFSLGAGWMVQDVKQSKVLYLFQAFVHGFRMQLFMVLSGFFTAMLWRQKGLKNLLQNRFQRILLPCLAGLLTVVPAIQGAGHFAALLRNPPGERTSGKCRGALLGDLIPGVRGRALAERLQAPDHPPKPHPGLTMTAFSPEGSRAAREFMNDVDGNHAESGVACATKPPPLGTQTTTPGEKRPVFILVWFLWFLVWLTPLFLVYAIAAERWGWRMYPHPLILSQRSLLWLVPITAIPGWFMGSGHGEFGPDTSMGVIPIPHVLMYYAVFYGFGVLYSESNDTTGRLGQTWRWSFPVSVLVVLPIALEFSAGTFGLRDTLLPAVHHRLVAVVFQALYAWMMAFAGIGMFRSLLAGESKAVRYLSDASYWFYLAHLPVVILLQAAVCTWSLPALLKFFGVCLVVSIAMLGSYETLVRYTFVGKFLNGPRVRPCTQAEAKTHASC